MGRGGRNLPEVIAGWGSPLEKGGNHLRNGLGLYFLFSSFQKPLVGLGPGTKHQVSVSRQKRGEPSGAGEGRGGAEIHPAAPPLHFGVVSDPPGAGAVPENSQAESGGGGLALVHPAGMAGGPHTPRDVQGSRKFYRKQCHLPTRGALLRVPNDVRAGGTEAQGDHQAVPGAGRGTGHCRPAPCPVPGSGPRGFCSLGVCAPTAPTCTAGCTRRFCPEHVSPSAKYLELGSPPAPSRSSPTAPPPPTCPRALPGGTGGLQVGGASRHHPCPRRPAPLRGGQLPGPLPPTLASQAVPPCPPGATLLVRRGSQSCRSRFLPACLPAPRLWPAQGEWARAGCCGTAGLWARMGGRGRGRGRRSKAGEEEEVGREGGGGGGGAGEGGQPSGFKFRHKSKQILSPPRAALSAGATSLH